MSILMLGNSFTQANKMPETLAFLCNCPVTVHTRSGARLAEHLNSMTQMGKKTQDALKTGEWEFVILQEMSNGPVLSKDAFMKSVSALCDQIKVKGAVPVLFATWAYKKDSLKMKNMKCSYEDMYQDLYHAYHEAAEVNGALVADVGKAFYELSDTVNLYAEDSIHPNETGSLLAAEILAETILNSIAGLDGQEASKFSEDKCKEIGARIRKKREELGASIEQLANAMGHSIYYYQWMEEGKVQPTAYDLMDLEAILGLSIDFMLNGDREKQMLFEIDSLTKEYEQAQTGSGQKVQEAMMELALFARDVAGKGYSEETIKKLTEEKTTELAKKYGLGKFYHE